jgi:hypothetical protein
MTPSFLTSVLDAGQWSCFTPPLHLSSWESALVRTAETCGFTRCEAEKENYPCWDFNPCPSSSYPVTELIDLLK